METTRQFRHYGVKVKQAEFHPSSPLLLLAQYDGCVSVFDYARGTLLRRFAASTRPLRAAVWLPGDQILSAGDDGHVRVHELYSTRRLQQFVAHSDFIRRVAVQPQQRFLLTCSDDRTIALFRVDAEGLYAKAGEWREHGHFVMDVKLDPREEGVFATASLDSTVKLWRIGATTSAATLRGHRAGVNCLSFALTEPLLLSGGDDRAILVWDLPARALLRRLEHTASITSLLFVPALPLVAALGEDGRALLYSLPTFEQAAALPALMGKGWTLSARNALLAAGHDEGAVVVRLGPAQPPTAVAQGRLLLVRGNVALMANLRADPSAAFRELGAPAIVPSSVALSVDAAWAAFCDGTNFALHRVQGFRNAVSGAARQIALSNATMFAVLRDDGAVLLAAVPTTGPSAEFSTLSTTPLSPGFPVSKIFGGALLCVTGAGRTRLYAWDGRAVGALETETREVVWGAQRFAVASERSVHLLSGGRLNAPLAVIAEIALSITSAVFHSDLLLLRTADNCVSALVGGRPRSLVRSSPSAAILSYVPHHALLFLLEEDGAVATISLSPALLDALAALPNEPALDALTASERDLLSTATDDSTLALRVAACPRRRAALATATGDFELAAELCAQLGDETLWRRLGDAALRVGRFALARRAFEECGARDSLLLLHAALGDATALAAIASEALPAAVALGDVGAASALLCAAEMPLVAARLSARGNS